MKKMKVIKSRKRFDEGGSVLRSTDGELVRFGYEDDDEYQKRVNADKAAQGRKKDVEFSGRTTPRDAVEKAVDDLDASNAGPKKPEQDKPPSKPEPTKPSKTYSEYDASEEPGSAGFSRTPLKNKPKPEKKPEKKPEAKPPGRTASGKTAEQEEEGRKKFAEDEGKRNLKRLQSKEKEEALEPINPEKYVGMGGLKALHGLAKGLASRGTAPVAGLLGRNAKTGENLVKDMGPVELAAGKRSMLQNQSGSSEPIRMGAANRYRAEQAKRNAAAKRQKETESDVSRFEGEGGRAMRKGGKVHKYAKGGSVGSASRRGDGIAMRGKTRGKMF